MAQTGVIHHGLDVVCGGSIRACLILGAIGTFIIDKDFRMGAYFALAGAVLSYLGFMHGTAMGIGHLQLPKLFRSRNHPLCLRAVRSGHGHRTRTQRR
jgi:hypothetical protein